MEFLDKKKKLDQILKDLLDKKLVLAFSGGVDSALLLKLLSLYRKEENDVVAMFFKALSTTDEELTNAKNLAREMDVNLVVEEFDILTDEHIINNSVDRCFHCKSLLFSKAIELKDKLGYGYVIDGTNTDDHLVYRPGLKALKELGVISPLNKAGLSKADVRAYAGELGIRVAKKPSAPCLLTRFPYGTKIDAHKLKRVEEAEDFIKSLGFGKMRVRDHDNIARIEVEKDQFINICQFSNKISQKLKDLGFAYVTLDLEGFRSGSMDEGLSQSEKDKWKIDG